jgi:hypothetical protein
MLAAICLCVAAFSKRGQREEPYELRGLPLMDEDYGISVALDLERL